ncbi:MAG: DUF3667 domain-containing protein [Pseudomonadales bacterium]
MRCPNCAVEHDGRYCPNCGQNDRNYQRALPPMLGELLRETFELDSRLLKTLRLLLFHPGQLTQEFSRNRRASYVSPIRLYLFASVLFFFLLSLNAELTPLPAQARIEMEASAGATEVGDAATLAPLLDAAQRARLDAILARPDSAIARVSLDAIAREVAGQPQPPGRLGRYLIGTVVDAFYEPGRTVQSLMDDLPVAMFLMLPIYAALLALVYRSRRRYYVEHLVFAVHVHTVTYILFTVLMLLPSRSASPALNAISAWLGNGLLVGLATYQYVALRRYYGGSRLATLWRFAALSAAYTALLAPAVLAVIIAALTLL